MLLEKCTYRSNKQVIKSPRCSIQKFSIHMGIDKKVIERETRLNCLSD